jgi:hypothetical protein
MTIKSTALIAAVTFLCVACNNSKPNFIEGLTRDVSLADNKVAEDSTADCKIVDTLSEPQQQIGNSEQKNQNNLPPKPIDWDKKIIKTANLNVEVKDYKKFSQQLNEKVKKYGGYISQEEESQSDYQIQNSVVIKVPVDQFENAVNDFTKDVSKLNEKHISSEDVTTQLVDGKSRLEAKKQVRLRYLDLLKQAKNMEEILTVQKEINDIQEDIELVNGRINTLSHKSAMSTINFTFFQIINANAKADSEKQPGFLQKVKEAFANGWYWIGELFIGLISISPLLAVITLGFWFYKKRQVPVAKQNTPVKLEE